MPYLILFNLIKLMSLKNSYDKKNEPINEKRKTLGKSVDKIKTKFNGNNNEISNFKYLDDTNFKTNNSYYFLLNNLNKSCEKEDSTSKDSKDLNILSEDCIAVASQISFSFLGKEKTKFENLIIEKKINNKILQKKKYNKVQKQIKLSYFPKKEDEFYDENKKYDFLSKIKPKGLRNLGGCCYMNATLQCFFHIKELTYYFLDSTKEIKRKNGVLSSGYLDLVQGLSNTNKESYYVPQKFKNSLLEIDDTFRGSYYD